LIKISEQTIDTAKLNDLNTSGQNIIENSEKLLFDLAEKGSFNSSLVKFDDAMKQTIEMASAAYKNEGGIVGVPTGLRDLDDKLGGLHQSDLIIIAGRPSMGKTSLATNIAFHAANNIQDSGRKSSVAFFSLEMSSVQLITRLISAETGLSSEKLRTGKLADHEWKQLNVKVGDLEKAPLFIDDTPALSIFDLRAKARRLASQHQIKLIVVDYLQLMTAGNNNKAGNREQEISTISRNLKSLAKELNIPVIALSQLSRAVETRGGTKRPQLSDLRESGAIEQDADIVSFIYRPEYYQIEEWDDEEHTSSIGQAEFIVAKHRNGGLDNIRMKFIGQLGKFEDLQSDDSSYEYQSKMNNGDDSKINKLSSPNDAFDLPTEEQGDDIPF